MDHVETDVLVWAVLLVLTLLLLRMNRQVRSLRARVPELGLPAGSRAPGLDRLAPAPSGPTLLLFLSSGCGGCPAVLEKALDLAATGDVVPMRAVFAGDPLPMGAGNVIPVHTGEQALLNEYRVPGTPFAVLVEAGRVRRAEPVRSLDLLQELASPSPN
ncbi:hypothetical protein GCM10009678_65640 [Actinomadura kijaniata]|uniref:Thioredoxin domain-containing protein n=1 Tax=Actinomadura namibiensis TaxID=182080 RepID=A0A7W3LPD3_ACTNM|nr:hypothetical protein [Actinomadura namibiensis]MBA8951843.1 hypothetical protein [Actinomadura namibiensis]